MSPSYVFPDSASGYAAFTPVYICVCVCVCVCVRMHSMYSICIAAYILQLFVFDLSISIVSPAPEIQ